MQLSLSSVPADSGASSLLNGLPGATGGAANDPAAGAAAGPAGGFAQMLAGCGTPGSAAPVAPVVVPPGAVTPGTVAVFNLADARLAPATPAVDPAMTGVGVPFILTGTPIGDGVPAAAPAASDKSAPSPSPRPKDLTAVGDLQALSALFAPLATPPSDPTLTPTGAASEPPDQASIDSDAPVASPGAWALPSPLMTLRPTFLRSPDNGAIPPSGQAAADAFAPVAEPSPFQAAVGAVMKQPALVAPNPPPTDHVPVAAAQPSASPVPGAPELSGGPLNAASPAPSATDASPAPVLDQARVLAQMQGTEKIAAVAAEGTRRGERAGIKVDAKSFVATDRKALTRFDPGLGIDTAKPDATMPAGATLDRKTSSDPVVPTTAPVSETRADSVLPAPVALTSTAHRAVEAALATADRFAARDQHAVTLQFSVGGSDLNVRVELRAGEVHTTFRTDSPELRAALSSEWQAVTSQSPADRPVRLAAPVFASAQDSGGSFSGDGAARQHQQDSSNSGTAFPGATPVRSSARGNSSRAGSAGSVAAAPRSAAANSVHLHTLA